MHSARIQFESAIESNPNNAEAYCSLGNYFFLNGHFSKAIDCYKQCLRIDPKLEAAKKNLQETLIHVEEDERCQQI